MNYSKGLVIKNLIWKFSERIGIQVANLVIQIILTRVLLPEDYANVAIIMVFVQLANLIVQSGFGSSLIQKEKIDERDFSSVFIICLFVSLILYGVLYISAPAIASFYNLAMLKNLLRVQAVILFPCAINTVQVAYLSRNMEFRKNFIASIVACVVSGCLGIGAALIGLGIWSIVICNIANQIILTVILWFLIKWRPSTKFSFYKVKELFRFGWKLLVSSVLSMFYSNLQTLIIGKVFTPTLLGYYNRGELMGTTVMSSVNNAISSVMLPVLSRYQTDLDSFKKVYRRILILDCFFSFPIMFGLASVAESFIVLLFTEKWLPAAPFMTIICIARAFDPIHVTNLQAILSIGRSDITLKLEVTKKLLGLALMLITYNIGIYAFVASNIILAVISTIINAYPNAKAFSYSFKEQIKDIGPYITLSIVMFIATYSVNFLNINAFLTLVLQIFAGVIIYVLGCICFKLYAFEYVLNYIKPWIRGKK